MSTMQRGSGWSIKLVFNFYKLFGYTFIYYLMYPVTFFYFVVASNVKAALKDYYYHINLPFNNMVYFHHLRHFAITMCDRFVSKVSPNDYSFEIENETDLMHELNQGCIILLSHFGGWATAGNCFKDLKINIVMQEVLLSEIKKIEETLPKSNTNLNIIDLSKGGVNVALEIAAALSKNESVAMMGDRATDTKNNMALNFFEKKANFNKSPFAIAYKTDKPIIGLTFTYQKPQCYKLTFTTIKMDKSNPQEDEIKKAIQAYVDFFSSAIKSNPEQWFNLYYFWKEKACS